MPEPPRPVSSRLIPARSALQRRLFSQLTHHLRHRCGLPASAGLLVACSGGADSVALLRALHTLAPRRRWGLRVEAVHVQHHLRPEAERDAEFVANLCETLGVPCHRIDLDWTAPADRNTTNLEDRARLARREAFAGVAAERRLSWVATAHHADDQLETVLLRLARGSGIRGQRAIQPAQPLGEQPGVRLIRPLLTVTRQTLREYLGELGQTWREDPTNGDVTRARAALRPTVVPALLDLHPDLPERLDAWTTHARHLADLLEDAASHVRFPLERREAKALNPAVLGQALRDALIAHGESPDRVSASRIGSIHRAATGDSGKVRSFVFGRCVVTVDRTHVSIDPAK